MPPVTIQHYIQRATDFGRGMRLTLDDDSYKNSSALLAIHSAISYADALRVGLGDRQLSSDDHKTAADTLKQLLASRPLADQAGLGHLQYLISKKSGVAYGDQRLDTKIHQMVITKAERFAQWANNVGAQLNIEGWKHDDN